MSINKGRVYFNSAFFVSGKGEFQRMGIITIKNLSSLPDSEALMRVAQYMNGERYLAQTNAKGKYICKIVKYKGYCELTDKA